MTGAWPRVSVIDETMREGMQIESVDIPLDDKVRLLDALSGTGLRTLVVGSFVSPRWVPQMARIEQLLERFTPRPGVTYLALALNQRGVERRAAFSPPLTEPSGRDRHATRVHLCDVFIRRNTGRGQADEIARWPGIVERAVAEGATEASIGIGAAWGSNWVGGFELAYRMELLARQHQLWTEAGVRPTKVWIGDPMGWNLPHVVAEQLRELRRVWPEIDTVHLHLHNTRGLALVSAYAALTSLGPEHHLILDSALGGVGGCPYCGNGRATGMMATDDLVHLLEHLGIATGVDLDRLIDAALLAERVFGRRLDGHVCHAGPLPSGDRLYPMDLPLVETFEEAMHFREGAPVEGRRPWREPIASPQRPEPPRPAHPAATTDERDA
jgi:hydroxymethylglutaryl-CoA lyase